MGATIIEQDDTQEATDELDTSDSTEVVQETEQVEDELPEKYKGKSVADIVRMHQEAEKALGKQGQELGELRKVADDYIKRTLGGDNPQREVPPKVEEQVDFFADPQKAVEKMIERDPRIKSATEAAELVRRETATRALMAKHPDAMEVAQSEDFQEWVAASKVRTKLFALADQQYDYEAAEELISTYKALKPKAPEKSAPALKSDSKSGKVLPRTVTGGTEGDTPSKKIYCRADIIKLQTVDPQRYLDMQDEIMQAYREGRVR